MNPLTEKDLWPLPVYERVRDEFRREVIAAKAHRRVALGPVMTLIFENRLTVKFQIQEILRVERIATPEGIAEELEGFNTLVPRPGELSATLMIELRGAEAEVAAELRKLTGFSRHLRLELGGRRIPAGFDQGRDDGQRISAVQYVHFPVGDASPILADLGQPAALVSDHPAYSHRAPLSDDVRRSLASDLDERQVT